MATEANQLDWSISFGTSLEGEELKRQRLRSSVASLSPASSGNGIARGVNESILLVAHGSGNFQVDDKPVRDIYKNRPFLVYLDKEGRILWSRILEGFSDAGSNSFYAVSDADEAGNHIVITSNSLRKYSASGEELWKTPLPSIGQQAIGIERTSDGSAIITGRITGRSPTVQFGENSPIRGDFDNGFTDGTAYIAKVSSEGLFEWSRKIAKDQKVRLGKAKIASFDDGSFAVGYAKHLYGDTYSSYIDKYSPGGNLLWSKNSNLSLFGPEVISSIGNGQIIYTGRMANSFRLDDLLLHDNSYSVNEDNRFIVSLDASGSPLWGSIAKNIEIREIASSDNGSVLVAGTFEAGAKIGDLSLDHFRSVGGILFIAELDPLTGRANWASAFTETQYQHNSTHHNLSEIEIVDASTLLASGKYWSKLNVAGKEYIDLDGQPSVYLAEINTNFRDTDYKYAPYAIRIIDVKIGGEFSSSLSAGAEFLYDQTLYSAAQLKAFDEDPSDTHLFSLVPGQGDDDNELFDVANNRLSLRIRHLESVRNKETVSIRLRVIDLGGNGYEQSLKVDTAELLGLRSIAPEPPPLVLNQVDGNSTLTTKSTMDFTGDGVVDSTDALLMMRHMMGTFPGDAITQGIPGITDVDGLRQKIVSNMEHPNALGGGRRMDIDGDGIINPLSDGLAITQYIHGKGRLDGMPQMPDVFKNPIRGFDEMQNHLRDLVGF